MFSKIGNDLWVNGFSWSDDVIKRRVETRHAQQSYATDMSACHTSKAIQQRTKTRKINGVNINIEACNSIESSRKIRQTKRKNILMEIYNHYRLPLIYKIIERSKNI